MPLDFARSMTISLVLVLGWPALVHSPQVVTSAVAAEPRASARAKPAPARATTNKTREQAEELPAAVAEMRDAMLAAVAAGRIEELQVVLDWNELKPEVAEEAVSDPVAYWRRTSSDGEGRDVLMAMGGILQEPHAVLPVGRDVENNRLYVWPRFAEVADDQLTPAEKEARLRIVPPDVREEMQRTGRYLWWRIAIGADGTWHSFVRGK